MLSLPTLNFFCGTLINFLSIIKPIPQFLIKGKLFHERKRGRERSISLSLSLSTLIQHCKACYKPLLKALRPRPGLANWQGHSRSNRKKRKIKFQLYKLGAQLSIVACYKMLACCTFFFIFLILEKNVLLHFS